MKISLLPRLCLAIWLILSCLAAFAADEVLARARQLIERNDPNAAYNLLVPLQSERAGDPEYDLLLGIAANNAGKYSEAVFALERVLAVDPNNTRARAEIARAYFALGETATAKGEFETVKKQSIPPEVAATVQKFLEAIEQLEAVGKPKVAGYLELTVGHDSNVNSATSSGQIAIPAFGGAVFQLSPTAVRASDAFASVAGGINARYPFKPGVALVAGLDLINRANSSQDRFDTRNLGGNVGLNFLKDKDSYTLALQTSQFDVDNNRFRNAYGVVGQWLRNFREDSSISAYLQLTRLEYPGQDQRNADRSVLGAAYGHAFGGQYSPVAYVGAYFGEERVRAAGFPQFGHDLKGIRAGGQLTLSERTVLFASTSMEERNYDGPDPTFLVTRSDFQNDVRIGLTYRPAHQWLVTPQVSYTRNGSNVILNSFERTVVSVSVRREFN